MRTTFGHGQGKMRITSIRKLQAVARACGASFHYVAGAHWFFSSEDPNASELVRVRMKAAKLVTSAAVEAVLPPPSEDLSGLFEVT